MCVRWQYKSLWLGAPKMCASLTAAVNSLQKAQQPRAIIFGLCPDKHEPVSICSQLLLLALIWLSDVGRLLFSIQLQCCGGWGGWGKNLSLWCKYSNWSSRMRHFTKFEHAPGMASFWQSNFCREVILDQDNEGVWGQDVVCKLDREISSGKKNLQIEWWQVYLEIHHFWKGMYINKFQICWVGWRLNPPSAHSPSPLVARHTHTLLNLHMHTHIYFIFKKTCAKRPLAHMVLISAPVA